MIRFSTVDRDNLFAQWKCGMPSITGSGSAELFWEKLVEWITDSKGRMAECFEDDWHYLCAQVCDGQREWNAGQHGASLVRLWEIADYLTEISVIANESLAIAEGQKHLRADLSRQHLHRRRGGAVGGGNMSGEIELAKRERIVAELWRSTRQQFDGTDSAFAKSLALQLNPQTTAKTVLAIAVRLRLRAKGAPPQKGLLNGLAGVRDKSLTMSAWTSTTLSKARLPMQFAFNSPSFWPD